jgi:hypothetical protein
VSDKNEVHKLIPNYYPMLRIKPTQSQNKFVHKLSIELLQVLYSVCAETSPSRGEKIWRTQHGASYLHMQYFIEDNRLET